MYCTSCSNVELIFLGLKFISLPILACACFQLSKSRDIVGNQLIFAVTPHNTWNFADLWPSLHVALYSIHRLPDSEINTGETIYSF